MLIEIRKKEERAQYGDGSVPKTLANKVRGNYVVLITRHFDNVTF